MKPLDGVKVMEFSTMITASFAAMMLAEQGATVIKVEPIDLGDPLRYLGTSKAGISAIFANCNRGKRSLRLDIKSDAGRDVILKLAEETDVVLSNFRPGVMDSLGMGSEALRAINPRLIYAGVSGFGTKGPHKDAPAYDPVIQAQVGFGAVQGQGKDGPELVRNLACDKITAYTACQAVTAALFARERTGEGQNIDLSMMDAGLYFLFPDGFMHHTLLDDDAEHGPPLSELLFDLNVTADGALTIAASSQAQQVGLFKAIDRLDIFADDRFNSVEKLYANLDQLRAILKEEYAKHETESLLAKLHENDVPAAKCLSYEEVIAHPQYEANGSTDIGQHALMGAMHRVLPPAQFGGDRLPAASDSPDHGQHTMQVLAEIGLSEAEIATMVEQGVARPQD